MSKNVMNSFVKQFVAKVKGDDVEVQAEKAWRQANAALKSHIAVLEGDITTKEDAVTTAQENLDNARINGGKNIVDRPLYIHTLISAKETLKDAQKKLDAHNATIAFLNEEWENLKKEA